MSNAPHDIMMAAHDNLGREVSITIHSSVGLGGVWVKRATIVAVSEVGQPHIVVENYRDASGHTTLVIPRTIILASEIIDISRA
jgi:predicted urease superfamily metal-dependent hydrolase